VREAGAAFALVARAHVIINSNGNDGHGMVFIQNDSQAVTQTVLFYRCVWNLKSFLHKSLDLKPRVAEA